MSSPLHEAFRVGGYDVLEVHEDQRELLVLIGWVREKWRCSQCAWARSQYAVLAHRSVWSKPTWVVMDVPRVNCLDCGSIRRLCPTIATGVAAHDRLRTGCQPACTVRPPIDLSRYLDISWDAAATIDERRSEALPKPKFSGLKESPWMRFIRASVTNI